MNKNIFIVAVTIFLGIAQAASAENLDSMPQKQRDSLLITRATTVMKSFYPGYYREGIEPVVTRNEFFFDGKTHSFGDREDAPLRRGKRVYYKVSFGYNKAKETYHKDYLAKVKFWADEDGKPNTIDFISGNLIVLPDDLFQPDGSISFARADEIPPIPFHEYGEFITVVMKVDPAFFEDTTLTEFNLEDLKARGYQITEDEVRKFGFKPMTITEKKLKLFKDLEVRETGWWERIPKDSIK